MELRSPKEYFGFAPGKTGELYNWPDMVRYFELLAESSPRVTMRHMGLSSDGNPFIAVFVSEEETIQNLEKYRNISMQLSDPGNLSEDELNVLYSEGKVVCFQMSGLHAYELTPSQNSPELVYELASGNDSKTLEILKNTILIVIPCANPDGLIDAFNWNQEVYGTKHNRLFSPHIYAKYSGHSNFLDNVYENIVESSYINQILYREWMPQVMVDQHQGLGGDPKMHFGGGTTETELVKGFPPLLVRELQLLTAEVAYELQSRGFSDIQAHCTDYTYSYCHFDNARAHNIVGILSELRDTTFTAEGHQCRDSILFRRKTVVPTGLIPDPDLEHPWTRSDATAYIHAFEMSLLLACARNRERLLRGMVAKAISQTKRGEKDAVKAYMISPNQHDTSVYHRLLKILVSQRVRCYRAKETLRAGNVLYPEGTLVIPCAQPNYMLVKNLFDVNKIPEADCNIHINESEITTNNIALLMGVEVHEAYADVEGNMELVENVSEYTSKYPLPACENASYKEINRLLREGERVFYDESTDTYVTEDTGVSLKHAKIGLFKLSRFIYFRWDQVSNDENPCTAMLLDRYGFDWRYIGDKEIREGIPKDIDILIIPGEWRTALEQGDKKLEGYPDEYTCGLGELGAESIREFVKRGGRLVAWSSAAGWAIHAFDLRIQDGKMMKADGIPYWERHNEAGLYGNKHQLTREDLCVCGPMLLAEMKKDKLTRGMPSKLPVLAVDPGPVMRVTSRMEDFPFAIDYKSVAHYVDAKNMHINGEVRGLKYLEYSSCLVSTKVGEGEVVLYSFDPKFRGQTEGTFKLLFNALYL